MGVLAAVRIDQRQWPPSEGGFDGLLARSARSGITRARSRSLVSLGPPSFGGVVKDRAVATKAKLKEDKKASRRRKFASKPPEIVRDAKGVPVHKHQAPSQQRSTQKPKRRR